MNRKNKKKVIIISFLSATLLLGGCSFMGMDSAATPYPEDNTESYIEAETEYDTDAYEADDQILQDHLRQIFEELSLSDESAPEYLRLTEERMAIEVLSCSQDGESAQAEVRVTAPDLYHILKDFEGLTFETDSEMEDAMLHAIESASTVENHVTVPFYYENQKWVPSLTEEFVDACYGGVLTYRSEYLETWEEETE